MAKKMLIDATHPEETRVVVVDGNRVEEFDYETVTKVQIAGNIYLAKVTRVEPSLQAAFVDYGGNRHGFLAFAEIHPDYYQIPQADREALLAAERAAAADAEEAEERETADRREGRGEGRGRGSRRRGGDGRGRDRRDDRRDDKKEERNGERGDQRGGRRRKSRGPSIDLSDLSSQPTPERLLAAAEATSGLWGLAACPTDLSNVDPAIVREATQPVAEPTETSAPDLSDVTQIEIHTLDATGAVAVETFEVPQEVQQDASETVPSGDAAPAAQAEAASSLSETISAPAADDPLPVIDIDPIEPELDAAPQNGAVSSLVTDETQQNGGGDAEAGDDAEQYVDEETGDGVGDDASADDDEPRRNDIEEVGADDALDEAYAPRIRLKDYKIQEVIKRRQIMLVQVVKEERGTKGAALTTYLSLAGRYCVLMPNTARGGGISRKITNAADRKRLKALAQELEVPDGMGLIVRTAGANRTKAEIKRDYEYLLRQWSSIRDLTLRSVAPAPIYEEGSLIKRAIRDLYNKDIDAVTVEGEDGYLEAKEYMAMLMPSHAKNVQPHREQTPLFIRHQIESQLSAMMNPTVQLKSGGYLVIGVTEALVAIDVNSGKSTKEGSIEETALKTNLEAAEEVSRQLKLRDLAGLIVVDFIDMDEGRNNRAVEKRLKDKLKTDRARIQIGRISGFGLLEMSRQRLRPGLLEATTTPCPHCKGTGVIRSPESMALAILRAVEEEGVRGRSAAVRIGAPVGVANYLINHKRARLAQIEARYGVQVIVEGDPAVVSPDFVVERVKPIQREDAETAATIQVESGFIDAEVDAPVADAEILDNKVMDNKVLDDKDAAKDESAKPKRRRRRRSGGEIETETNAAPEADVEPQDEPEGGDDVDAAPASDDGGEADDDESASKRRRGRRGGRRRKKSTEAEAEASDDPLPVIDLDAPADAAELLVTKTDDPVSAAAEARDEVQEAGEALEAENANAQDGDASATDGDQAATLEASAEAVAEGTETAEAKVEVKVEAEPQQAAADDNSEAATTPGAATADTSPETAPAPEPALVGAATEEARPARRRTGWWSLRRGA